MVENNNESQNYIKNSKLIEDFKKDNLSFISSVTEILFKQKDEGPIETSPKRKINVIDNLRNILGVYKDEEIASLTEATPDVIGKIKRYAATIGFVLKECQLHEDDKRLLDDKFRLVSISANGMSENQGKNAMGEGL